MLFHSHGFHKMTTFMSWTFPRPAFSEEGYYEQEGYPEGGNADYGYLEEGHPPKEEYADEGYGYAS